MGHFAQGADTFELVNRRITTSDNYSPLPVLAGDLEEQDDHDSVRQLQHQPEPHFS